MGSSFGIQSLSESSGEGDMPVAAGIDEVGYGPKLGPLVVAAAAFRVEDPSVNLWDALASAVSDRRNTERLPVLDSKELIVRIGKQGGRRLYLAGLVREFGTVWVHGETAATSRYEFREGGRRVLLEFLMDGERRDFGIALASIVGKYLREGAMRLFNAYWARQREGLRATAGYGADARRFFREIEPHLERLRIAPDAVLRKR